MVFWIKIFTLLLVATIWCLLIASMWFGHDILKCSEYEAATMFFYGLIVYVLCRIYEKVDAL